MPKAAVSSIPAVRKSIPARNEAVDEWAFAEAAQPVAVAKVRNK